MNFQKSLQFKLIAGIVAVIAPLVVYHLYNNHYAIQVVREKVASSNGDLVNLFVQSKVDQTLEDTGKYLLNRAGNDPDVTSLNLYGYDDGEYQMRKVRIINRFRDDLALYNAIDTFYVYSRTNDDLTLSNGNYQDFGSLAAWVRESGFNPNARWEILRNGSAYGLTMAVPVTEDVSLGAWINLNRLLDPFRQLNLGGGGEAIAVDPQGKPLTPASITEEAFSSLGARFAQLDRSYAILGAQDGNYLVVGTKSRASDIRVVVLVPEANLLQKLPFFQWTAWIIPTVAALVLILYVLWLKSVLFRPLGDLMRGMRRIIHGDLEFRLALNKSSELSFFAATFNHMAEQIHQLKIDVYEEQLRVKRAELKHLQVQINPHFYLNSLHIIYNLATLKLFKQVQKLSLYLADYFKFTIRTNRTSVTVEEEVKHIQNYLEIQKLRYPDLLAYEFDLRAPWGDVEIPALTIQPFVENAIVHGLNMEESSFRILIRTEAADDGRFAIVVRDNGAGFPAEQLEKLDSGRYLREADGTHIGIWNVIHRLNLSFGGAAEIRFANAAPKGAEVRILLPGPPAYEQTQGGQDDVQRAGSG
ncbi:sensor histidine kinase [Cohnella nanjingensis]|uniref:Histidine kinase n=1 Tax=Cohnella nanjingensis TaxID=1387779 RepID=A0A7X0VHB3_9BACL|nr:histidine kinase [Cohnella nanjingensis]MBB6673987.1 histidine kinase [Cohnella nanjingensis]